MHKKLLFIPLFILLSLILGGCQSAAPVDPATIDLATLPTNINVQTAFALQQNEDVIIIDVREQWEYDAGHIPGVTHIPMGEIANRLAEIPQDKTVVISCQSGARSAQVTKLLQDEGFTNIHNLSGGYGAWERAGYATEK